MEVVHELHQAQFHAFLALCREGPATHHALHLAKVMFGNDLDPQLKDTSNNRESIMVVMQWESCEEKGRDQY